MHVDRNARRGRCNDVRPLPWIFGSGQRYPSLLHHNKMETAGTLAATTLQKVTDDFDRGPNAN